MTLDIASTRHPDLQAAIDRCAEADRHLKEVARSLQASCCHSVVVHFDSAYGYNRRVCRHCGLAEEGTKWSDWISWRREDDGKPLLGNDVGRDVVVPRPGEKFIDLSVKP